MLMEFFMGNRGLNVLYDPFFKKIMNQERLEHFLSQVMEQEVTIVKILPQEALKQSEEGSVMIMDMIVKLADGSYVDLEIQRISVEFPFERAVCYASDLTVRQYEQLKLEQKQAVQKWRDWKEALDNYSPTNEPEPKVKFNYQSIRPVYVIVLMNSSSKKYRKFEKDYIHRTADHVTFDTGLEEQAIQRFIFISLDIFRRLRDNGNIKNEPMTDLEAWMYFLSSDRPEDITRLIKEHPEFESAYREINQFRMHPEEMMSMISEAIRILDEGDAKLQIEMLHEELKEKDDIIKAKDDLINELQKQLDDTLDSVKTND